MKKDLEKLRKLINKAIISPWMVREYCKSIKLTLKCANFFNLDVKHRVAQGNRASEHLIFEAGKEILSCQL